MSDQEIVQLNVRVPAGMVRVLDELAADAHLSRAHYLARLVKQAQVDRDDAHDAQVYRDRGETALGRYLAENGPGPAGGVHDAPGGPVGVRPVYRVDFDHGEHYAIVLSNRNRRLANPKVTVIPGQSRENLALVAQLVVRPDEVPALRHDTWFSLDEILTVHSHRLLDHVGDLGEDREVELLEKLTDAWDLHRPGGFPLEW